MRLSSLLFAFLLASPLASAQTFTSAPIPQTSGLRAGASIVDADGNGLTDLVRAGTVVFQRSDRFEVRPFDVGLLPLGAVFGDVTRNGLPEALILDGSAPGVFAYDRARQEYAPTPGGLLDVGDAFFLTQGSILFDVDRDGALDVLIGNDGGIDLLYRGLGDGTFEDISEGAIPDIEGGDYGMMAADYDRDGDDDVAIGLCRLPGIENLLFEYTGSGFAEVAAGASLDDPRASWGIVWLDFDNDGWLDLYVANMLSDASPDGSNGLFRNNGDGTFTDTAVAAGVAGPVDEDSWNVTAADFDNDGWLDLFVINFPEPSRLYRNEADGTFTDVSAAAGLPVLKGIPAAVADVNGDGWVDIYMPDGFDFSDILLLNDGGTNGWLSVDLTGVASNRDGIGARVEVSAGDLQMVREITAGDGFMSQSHGLTAHFGLGTTATADITVRWPSGEVDVLEGVPASQKLTIVEGVGIDAPPAMFALTSPAEGAVVPLGEPVTLAWEPATDTDAVTYAVHFAAPDGTDTTFETTATEFEVPAASLTAEGTYRWAVVARDAYSARTSLDNASFITSPNVASEAASEAQALALELWPNPARDAATLRFEQAVSGSVEVEVYELLGRRVQHLELGVRGPGTHTEHLALGALPAGVYTVRLVGAQGELHSARLVRVE